jgi:hypothetical protein
MIVEKKSELAVVMKAKELCGYIMTVTQKSPKQFRFTFVSRLQNLSLDIIENIYYANETMLGERERLNLQHKALVNVKLLAYFAELALTQGCILAKQYEQIAKNSTDCRYMLGAWVNSDKKRLMSSKATESPPM